MKPSDFLPLSLPRGEPLGDVLEDGKEVDGGHGADFEDMHEAGLDVHECCAVFGGDLGGAFAPDYAEEVGCCEALEVFVPRLLMGGD